MKTKLIGIFVCVLLIATALPITGQVTKSIVIKDNDVINPSPNGNTWKRTFGGTGADRGYSVQQTSDGGYIVAGDTYSYGAGKSDAWLIKTDKHGNELWNKTFGGKHADHGRSVQQTIDGGYIIAGDQGDYYGSKIWLIKTDDGDQLWEKTYASGIGRCVRQTIDGGFIIVGLVELAPLQNKDILLLKTDKDGNELWNKTFGGKQSDSPQSVQQTIDGGYIIFGHKEDEEEVIYAWLIKTDGYGVEVWNKTLGLNIGWGDVLQTSDTGFMVVGTKFLSDTSKGCMIKLDADGNEKWRKYYSKYLHHYQPWSFSQASDGGFIITGLIWDKIGFSSVDLWLAKTDSNGNLMWSRRFGKKSPPYGFEGDCGYSVKQTFDGGYIVSGATSDFGAGNLDVWLIKTDSNGNVPRNRATYNSLFLRFLEQFPILQKMLLQR